MDTKRAAIRILLVAPLGLATCVLESNDQTLNVGEHCVDGATCGPSLLCFIPGNDPDNGSCIEPPEECNGEKTCDCLGELEAECDTGFSCLGVIGELTAACAPAPGLFRQRGETCAALVPCAGDLLCVMPAFGEVGTCDTRPTCLDDPDFDGDPCDCLAQHAATVCPSGTGACFVVGDAATLQC